MHREPGGRQSEEGLLPPLCRECMLRQQDQRWRWKSILKIQVRVLVWEGRWRKAGGMGEREGEDGEAGRE